MARLFGAAVVRRDRRGERFGGRSRFGYSRKDFDFPGPFGAVPATLAFNRATAFFMAKNHRARRLQHRDARQVNPLKSRALA